MVVQVSRWRKPSWARVRGVAPRSNPPRSKRDHCMGRTEYIFVPTGAFYEARVCSDASLRCTGLNMLERI